MATPRSNRARRTISGLVAEQPDVLPGGAGAHDRQADECVVAQGNCDTEADPLAGNTRLQLLREVSAITTPWSMTTMCSREHVGLFADSS